VVLDLLLVKSNCRNSGIRCKEVKADEKVQLVQLEVPRLGRVSIQNIWKDTY